MATIRETVYEAIANAMKVDVNTLTDDTNVAAELGATSVDFVHVLSAIEAAHELTVPFMKLRRNKTIGEMVEFVEELAEEQKLQGSNELSLVLVLLMKGDCSYGKKRW